MIYWLEEINSYCKFYKKIGVLDMYVLTDKEGNIIYSKRKWSPSGLEQKQLVIVSDKNKLTLCA